MKLRCSYQLCINTLIFSRYIKCFRAKIIFSVTETTKVGINYWKERWRVKRDLEMWSILCERRHDTFVISFEPLIGEATSDQSQCKLGFKSPFLPNSYLQADFTKYSCYTKLDPIFIRLKGENQPLFLPSFFKISLCLSQT